MSEVSLNMHYFVLYHGGLILSLSILILTMFAHKFFFIIIYMFAGDLYPKYQIKGKLQTIFMIWP